MYDIVRSVITMVIKKKDFNFDENIMATVIKNIRRYRIQKNMTQEELAFYTDLSNDFVRRIECCHGARGVSLKTLYKISIVLEVTMDKFFE